jgi:predicted enzyme related to lactoylglutathione lyase
MTGARRGSGPRFVHVNLVARDWRRLARFYQEVFGCIPVPPERDYRGPALEAGTAVAGASLRGVHLRLPGGDEEAPTLEIFQYEPGLEHPAGPVNRTGFGHIAFATDDVRRMRQAVVEHGGSVVGDVVRLETSDGRRVTWTYVRDPEGNVLELQCWTRADGSPSEP